jgi:hypothetical protein
MAQQTAVDLLISELTKYGYIIAPSFGHAIIDELIKRAKEMEKQQIETAYNKGTINGIDYPISNLSLTGEQYYNETYKQK